jgi:histidinol-phosphate aminotransferase
MVVTEQAQRAALAVLAHNDEAMQIVHDICERRDRVWAALVDQGWDVPQPHGNFVWLPTAGNTEAANEILEQAGVIARVFAGEGIRVTIGEDDSVPVFIDAAARIVATNLHRAAANG